MLTSSLLVSAQETTPEIHYYYIEEASYDLLKPTNIVAKEDRTLKLEFENQNLTDFFATLDIHLYNREFEWSKSTYFHRYYVIGLERDDLVNYLESINEIVLAEYIGDLEVELFDTPNDYFDHGFIQNRWVNDVPGNQHVNITQNKKAYEQLELINARQAWNITKGSSDIAVGVVDTQFNIDHPDLENKIIQHYGAIWTGGNNDQHGTRVAGAAAADTDNGIGISSIGYNTSLVTAPMNPSFDIHDLPQVTTREGMALYMVEQHPEIKVLNFSWPQNATAPVIATYNSIVEDHNVTIVAAAGNGLWHSSPYDPTAKRFPASLDNVIAVSSVSSYNEYGHVDENGQEWGWKDVHDFFIGDTLTNHQRHDKIDLVAPGYLVPGPNRFDEYMLSTGTSFASPIVAGTAALMYDVHPDITPAKVKEILKATADTIYHIPENEKYRGRLGSGRLNAYAAVLAAKCDYTQETGLDLIMRNSEDDYGEEPDTATDVIWDSPDIWVRNQPDGQIFKQSEVLNYVDENTPAYVYVRVTNDSCEESSGDDTLELYWAKGGANQSWPFAWNGSTVIAGLEFGNEINQLPIPELKPGKSVIIEFEWFPKDPIDYESLEFVNNASMFCFLARIDSADDPMTTPEVQNAALNTRNNNNIAYKNATVINVSERPNRGSMVVGNIGGTSSITTSLEFFTNSNQDDHLWQDAEVYVQLNQNLWDSWQNSGGQFTDVRIIDPNDYLILT